VKRFRPGLRTEILLSLTVLLFSAMVLTSFIVNRIWERDMLRYKADDGKALIQRIREAVDQPAPDKGKPSLEVIKARLAQLTDRVGPPDGIFDQVVIRAKDGTLWAGNRDAKRSVAEQEDAFLSALRMEKGSFRVSRDQDRLTVTSPLFVGNRFVAAAFVSIPIESVLRGLRRSQKLIWFYIGLNVLVLLVFGTFLLSRIIINPIKRLVKTADHFVDAEKPFSFAPETDHNEMAHLTTSLNRMLKRLAENKEQMEAQIQSLEKANEELKEAREVVLRSEKLSALGRLAAGVAHEVGNPIGAVLGYTDLLMARVENDADAKDYLTRMDSEISRIDAIVREFLDFSRASPGDPAPVDVNALVSEATSFFSHQRIRTSVELVNHFAKDAGMVRADADQLKQVLINLLFNACDALEEGGRIAIHTRRKPRPEGEKTPQGQSKCVEISVSDTGSGISLSEKERIFDPFFTTKPPGKGTGLGLAISRRIVESFHGTLEVKSEEGKGSTFTVRLNPWEPDHDTKRSHHRPGRHQAELP
jgi:signal transduction histidine kinase